MYSGDRPLEPLGTNKGIGEIDQQERRYRTAKGVFNKHMSALLLEIVARCHVSERHQEEENPHCDHDGIHFRHPTRCIISDTSIGALQEPAPDPPDPA